MKERSPSKGKVTRKQGCNSRKADMTIGQKLHELMLAKGIPAAALDERFDIQRGALDELGERVFRT